MIGSVLNRVFEFLRPFLRSRASWFRLSVFLVLVGSFAAREVYIERALPYCRHVDEHTWTARAIGILQTSDLNPHRFTKPSVMVYLNAAGLALGLIRSASHSEKVYQPKKLKKGGYPYYSSPTAIHTLRSIYAGLSVVSMLLAALCMRRLTGSRGVTLLGLLLMAISPLYFRYSWYYLNVDILGVFFALLSISFALLRAPQMGTFSSSAIMGALGGLTVGTKYNLFWIALPLVIQTILIAPRRWRIESLIVFFGSLLGAFIVSTPYALLDLNAFVTAAAGEAHHYASGHNGLAARSGFPMLFRHLEHFAASLGWGTLVLSALGLFWAFWYRTRIAILLFSYPIALLAYMSTQSTYFPRNVLIWDLLLPVLAAIGAHQVFRRLRSYLSGRFAHWAAPTTSWLVGTVVAALALGLAPWENILQRFNPVVESRNEATEWILENVPRRSRLLVPEELALYPVPLERRYRLHTYEGRTAQLSALGEKFPKAYVLVADFKAGGDGFSVPKKEVLSRFGERRLEARRSSKRKSNYTPWGNPKFSIVKLD